MRTFLTILGGFVLLGLLIYFLRTPLRDLFNLDKETAGSGGVAISSPAPKLPSSPAGSKATPMPTPSSKQTSSSSPESYYDYHNAPPLPGNSSAQPTAPLPQSGPAFDWVIAAVSAGGIGSGLRYLRSKKQLKKSLGQLDIL